MTFTNTAVAKFFAMNTHNLRDWWQRITKERTTMNDKTKTSAQGDGDLGDENPDPPNLERAPTLVNAKQPSTQYSEVRDLIAKLERATGGHGMDADRALHGHSARWLRRLIGLKPEDAALPPDHPYAPVASDPPIGHSLSDPKPTK